MGRGGEETWFLEFPTKNLLFLFIILFLPTQTPT